MKRTQNRPRSRRRGVFLVELLITMTLGGMVMAIGLGLLHLLLRTDKALSDSLWRSRTVARLSETFRQDVHAARDVILDRPENPADNEPAGPVLSLDRGEDHQVRYAVDGPSLIRTETRGEELLRRERFRFRPGTEIVLEMENEDPTRPAVVIRNANPQAVRQQNIPEAGPVRELRIEAVAGRDYRFLATRNEQ